MQKGIALLFIQTNTAIGADQHMAPFCGEPLFIKVAKELDKAETIEKVVVATSQPELLGEIIAIAGNTVVAFKTDAQNWAEAAAQYNRESEFKGDFVLYVHPRYPFFDAEMIDDTVAKMQSKNLSFAATGHLSNIFNRAQSGSFAANGGLKFYPANPDNILNAPSDQSLDMLELLVSEDFRPVGIGSHHILFGQSVYRQAKLKRSKLADLKLFLTDIDGVMTDGSMYYTEYGDEIKRFHTHDGMGLIKLQRHGIKVGICTGEDRTLNQRRADKLKLDYAFHGISDKLTVVKGLCEKLNITLDQVGFIGDDVNDLELLNAAGFAACPANAVKEVKAVSGIEIMSRTGGTGVLRELVEEFFGL